MEVGRVNSNMTDGPHESLVGTVRREANVDAFQEVGPRTDMTLVNSGRLP